MSKWVKEFERKFQLKFFGNPTAENTEEKNIVYFENAKQTEWIVKIDQNIKVITIGKSSNNNFEIGKREKQIIDFLLFYSEKWLDIGLKEVNYPLEVKKVVNKRYQIEVEYGEKETINVIGTSDWSVF